MRLKFITYLELWDELKNQDKVNWINYINSFQVESKKFPNNSYIDKVLWKITQVQNIKIF